MSRRVIGRKVFSTGQIAKICSVAPRTVSKWFDSGQLKGYRIPGSKDRRVPREQLFKFLKDNDMPTDAMEDGILVVSTDARLLAQFNQYFSGNGDGVILQTSQSTFDAGTRIGEGNPSLVVMDLAMGRQDCLLIAQRLRQRGRPHVIALVGEDEVNFDELLESGFSEVFRKPFDVTLLSERVHQGAA